MIDKTSNGEILSKEITSADDIDDELVGHPDSIYDEINQQVRVEWLKNELKKNNVENPIMEIGTACGYILNKIDGDIGVDIRPDRLLVAKKKYPNKKFYYANVLNLQSFYKMGIKTIILAETLEHLPYDVVHHAIVHCLKTAPVIYYTVPNSETDISVSKNQEHKWYPTYSNLKAVLDYTAKNINMIYDIKSSNNFLYGMIKRTIDVNKET